MPRPVRKDLSYFNLDCDIFSTKSGLKPLIDRFQADGLAVYIHILCDVYGTGYYFKPDNYEDYLYALAKDIGISVNKVKLVLAFMTDRSLLDAHHLDKNTVFTSHGIQKRYAEAMKGRKRSIAEIKGDYWLLTGKEEAEIDTFYKSHHFENKSEENADKSEKNADKSEIYETNKQNRNKQEKEERKKENKYIKESSIELPADDASLEDFEKWDRHMSHAQIMDEAQISGDYRKALEEFLRYCYVNGHIVLNSKLNDIIWSLQDWYGNDEVEKIKSLKTAIKKGYFNIRENQ